MFQRMLVEEPPSAKNKAMIHQFESNCAPKHVVTTQVYSHRETTAQSGSLQGIMNRATLYDSTASQKNNTTGSNSQFLRKSLWLLTNTKSRSLRDMVQQQQSSCQLCHYIHAYHQLTVSANVGHQSAIKAVSAQSIFQTQKIGNAKQQIGTYFDIQGMPQQQALHKAIVNHQMSNVEPKLKAVQRPFVTDSQSKSLHQQQTSDVQGNTRIILRVSSPRSPQSPSSAKKEQNSARRQIKRPINNQGNSLSSHSNGSANGYILTSENVHVSAGYDGNGAMAQQINSVIIQHELHDRFESQYFYFLLKKSLITKYMTSQEYYNSKVSSDIMYNEQRHIVSVFKEYLIFDDFSEYLKRFYSRKESLDRLPRIFEFYDHYSKVFPNYVSIPESKYMFKNIERKQKLIDQRHQNFLRNQKKEKGDQTGDHKSSMLVLFNSQFLKEVYDEPKLYDSMIIDPRDRIQSYLTAKVLNKPPTRGMQDQSTTQIDISRVKELENIIHLLNRFDRVEDSIMAREVISDSLIKSGTEGILQLKSQVIPRKSKNELRINTEPDLSMSSWTVRSAVQEPLMTIQQDSEFELQSEIMAQSCDFFLENQITPKISQGLPATIQGLKQKPQFENNVESAKVLASSSKMKKGSKDEGLIQVRDFLNTQITKQEALIPSATQKSLQHTQSLRGIHLKQISIANTEKQDKELVVGRDLTRNRELNRIASHTQQQTIASSQSSVTAPLLRPGVNSAAGVRGFAQKATQNYDSKSQLGHERTLKITLSGVKRETKQSSENTSLHKSQGNENFQQNIKNLIKETNKILNSNQKLRESFPNQPSVQDQRIYQIENSQKRRGLDKESHATISRNDKNDKISTLDPQKQSHQTVQSRKTLTRIDQSQIKENARLELAELERLVKNGSRTTLGVASTYNSQSSQQLQQLNTKKLEDIALNRKPKKVENAVILDLNSNTNMTKVRSSSKLGIVEGRKIKTTIEVRETELSEREGKQAPNIFPLQQDQRPHMKIEPPATFGTKIAKKSLDAQMQAKPFIEKKKILKPSLDLGKTAQSNVYHIVGLQQNRFSQNQMTPYALINYYSKSNIESADSMRNLHQPVTFVSPDIKERTSKSENVQKTTQIKDENYKEWTDTKSHQKSYQKQGMTESATLAALKYFQSNVSSNPYDKTGRIQSALSVVTDNSGGKGSARGTHNFVMNASANKGRNKLPNSNKVLAVKMTAGSIVKPTSSLSGASLHDRPQKTPFIMTNGLPNHGGTGSSSKSGLSGQFSGHSTQSVPNQLQMPSQVYSLRTSEANLFAMAKKTTALMKNGTPHSTNSSGKSKKKQVTLSTGKSKAKVPTKQALAKKVLTGTQGHTIFSVNPKLQNNI